MSPVLENDMAENLETVCQEKPHLMINLTQIGDIAIEPLITKDLIDLLSTNPLLHEHRKVLNFISKKSIAPEQALYMWKKMKKRYQKDVSK